MAEKILRGLRVAVLTADGCEQIEVTRPVKTLRKRGALVDIVSLHPGRIIGMNFILRGKSIGVDTTVSNANPDQYDALYIPGGFVAPDLLRQNRRALDFVRSFDLLGKPIATMCHGPWLLVSAGLVEGRRLTSWPGIKDDIRNAGGNWVDEAVVLEANWLSSRGPLDLLDFDRVLVEHFTPLMVVERQGAPAPNRALTWGLAGLAAVVSGAVANMVIQRTYQRERDEFRPELPVVSEDELPITPVDAGFAENGRRVQ